MKQITLALATLLMLGGCRPQVAPQILTFNYDVRTVSDASALITSVQGGQTSVSDLLSRRQCNFTADFSSPTPPQVFINGTPGQMGFNVNLISTDPVAISTTNPPNCISLDEIEITIGGPSQMLALGSQTNLTNGRIWLVDGQKFDASDFFQARVVGFDPATRRSNGDFRFINRLAPGSNTILIAEGSYAMTP